MEVDGLDQRQTGAAGSRACAVQADSLADRARRARQACDWAGSKAHPRACAPGPVMCRQRWFAGSASVGCGRGRLLLGGTLRLIRCLKFSAPYLTTTSSLSPRLTRHPTPSPPNPPLPPRKRPPPAHHSAHGVKPPAAPPHPTKAPSRTKPPAINHSTAAVYVFAP